MRYQKLDNRFKMKKAGLATHMVLVQIEKIDTVNRILTEAFGPGQYVPSYQKAHHIRNTKDWFYDAVYMYTPTGITRPLQTPPIVKYVAHYRFYFRREEQAAYLKLAMS